MPGALPEEAFKALLVSKLLEHGGKFSLNYKEMSAVTAHLGQPLTKDALQHKFRNHLKECREIYEELKDKADGLKPVVTPKKNASTPNGMFSLRFRNGTVIEVLRPQKEHRFQQRQW